MLYFVVPNERQSSEGLKVTPLLSMRGISLTSGSSDPFPHKVLVLRLVLQKKKTKGNKEGHIARVSAMTVEIRNLMLGIVLSRLRYLLPQLLLDNVCALKHLLLTVILSGLQIREEPST